MPVSKIEICNVALAALGEDSIRDFAEGNKRARMCDVFYDITRDYLLGQFNWAFARKRIKLQQLSVTNSWQPEGTFAYSLPADCHKPLHLWPEEALGEWEIQGKVLFCYLNSLNDDLVVLVYTKYSIDPSIYSSQFINLLSLALSVRICMPITQDKELTRSLFQQYSLEKKEAWSVDAMIGNKHISSGEDATLDSFVDADQAINFTPGLD